MTARRKLSGPAFAERAQIKPATLRYYNKRAKTERAAGRDRPGLLPEPDGCEEISGMPWWYEDTADAWIANRAGRGRRTDLIGR